MRRTAPVQDRRGGGVDRRSCPMVVEAMRAGAFDFIEKPISRELFAVSLVRALGIA